MKRETQRVAPKPVLYPKEEVFTNPPDFGGEDCRGADGKPVYPGRTVKRPPYYSASLGVMVPEAWGKVKRLYRQEGIRQPWGNCNVVVETFDGHAFWLDQVVRSARGETAAKKATKREEGTL